jgi:hypothetical protein
MESVPSCVQFSSYELIPNQDLNAKATNRSRYGYLLRSGDSYADYFSWPELGDPTWQEDLSFPLSGRSPLFQRCLQILSEDFSSGTLEVSSSDWLQNHFLVGLSHQDSTTDSLQQAYQQGFRTFKIKVSGIQKPIFSSQQRKFFQQHSDVLIRLDANQSLSVNDLSALLDQLGSLKGKVEFLEDPFSLQDPMAWEFWNAQIPLAADFQKQDWMTKKHIGYFILKPQREDPAKWVGRCDDILSVITHSMEGPVGVALTIQQMPLWKKKWGKSIHPICGLTGFQVYQNFETVLFQQEGSKIRRSSLSLNDYLKGVVWQTLS